jgi:hypothetical protein
MEVTVACLLAHLLNTFAVVLVSLSPNKICRTSGEKWCMRYTIVSSCDFKKAVCGKFVHS